MSGIEVLAHLRRLCGEIDAGHPLGRVPWRRALPTIAAPALVGLAMGLAGCETRSEPVPAYGVPLPIETACTGGVDDDGDGLVDCGDPDCQGTPACAPRTVAEPDRVVAPSNAEYAAPPPGREPGPDPGGSRLLLPAGPAKVQVAPAEEAAPVVVYGRPFEEPDGGRR